MLITLLSDYLSKPAVRRAYAANPRKVLARYEVDPAQLAGPLDEAVAAEIRKLSDKSSGKIHPLGWGIPSQTIEVEDFSPNAADAGVQFTLNVEGKNFTSSCSVVVVTDTAPVLRFAAVGPTTFLDSGELEADFKLSSGRYRVAVLDDESKNPNMGDVLQGHFLKVRAANAKKGGKGGKVRKGQSR